MKNHPLFPEHSEADIEGIHVTRSGPNGVAWATALHNPADLTELSQVFALYGGGAYELIGRGLLAGKNGEKGKKGVCARVSYRIDGAPKPLNPEAAGPALAVMPVAPAAPAATGAPSEMMMMLQFMGQQMQATMQLVGTMMTAAFSNRPSGGDPSTVAAINALGEVVRAALASKTEAAAAAVSPQESLKQLMDLGDWLNGVKAGAAQIATKAAAGEDVGLDLKNLGDFAEKAIDVVKKAKGLADSGTPPHVAAEQLAREAAAAAGN